MKLRGIIELRENRELLGGVYSSELVHVFRNPSQDEIIEYMESTYGEAYAKVYESDEMIAFMVEDATGNYSTLFLVEA